MQHAPLGKIDNFRYLKPVREGWFTIVKPKGIDVFLSKGVLFDSFGRPIINKRINFLFKEALDVCLRTNMVFIGVLYSESVSIIPDTYFLYAENPAFPITDIKLFIFDAATPSMPEANLNYRTRYDIYSKVLEKRENIKLPCLFKVDKVSLLNEIIINSLIFPEKEGVILYDPEGIYQQGIRQIGQAQTLRSSFMLSSTQKFRGHVSLIIPTTVQIDGKELELASNIQAKYKSEKLYVPIVTDAIDFKRHLWTNRKLLKNKEFIFNAIQVNMEGQDTLLNIHFNKLIL